MSEMKLSLLDKKIAQFGESFTDLLADIHTRNKSGTKSKSTRGRKPRKTVPTPDQDIDLLDEEASGL
jgi:hypothetical protein